MMGLKRARAWSDQTGLPGTEAELPEELLNHVWAGLPVSRTMLKGGHYSERWLSRQSDGGRPRGRARRIRLYPASTRLTRLVDGVNGLCVYFVAYGGGSSTNTKA